MNVKIDPKLLFALFGVAIIWGTTYLGIRIAVQTIPPWFVTAIRQSIASLILFSLLVYQGEMKWLGWQHLRRQMILSLLMIVIANGLTTVAEQTITSGLTSLLISLVPILVYLGSLFVKLQKPSFKGFAGVLLGFLGVAFIFREGLGDILDPDYKIGMIYLSLAISAWAVGTIYIKKNAQHSDHIFLDLFYQFLFSVVVQFVLAFVFSGKTTISSWSVNSLMATAYLGIVGSVLGFFCFHYALKRVSVVKVSILSYFNTIIAIFLGWIVLGEVITTDIIIAAVLIITGVFIVNYKKKE